MFRLVSLLALVAFATAEVVYPCSSKFNDFVCYGKYFAAVAGCTPPVDVPSSDSWTARPITIEMPYFRVTIVRDDATIEGIANVEDIELYYDTEAGVTVFSYTFPSVDVYGNEEIQYHSPGTIDTVVETSFKTTYTNVKFTHQWQGIESITIGDSKRYAIIDSMITDVENDVPGLYAAITADPDGIVARTIQINNPEVYNREQETYAGRQIARPFWKNWICTNLPADD